MRVLVTGGAGFIGSHLCEHLHARGDQVVVLDDLSTGRRENLGALLGRPGFAFYQGSVRDAASVDALVAEADAVVHLAAAVGVRLVLEEPVRTLETNVDGTRVVLAAAARRGVPCLLASSSEVYGRSQKLPFREDDPLLIGATSEPRWSYACSKALGEWLALAHARERRLEVVIVRLFNTVGPRQRGRYGMVLPNLVSQALAGEPLTVFGDGRQTRCFLHVHEAVRACAALLLDPGARGEVFNVGSTHEVSILELARTVKRVTASGSPIVRMPYREAYGTAVADLRRRVPDVGKLAERIGFRPRIALEEMVRDVARDRRLAAALTLQMRGCYSAPV